MNTPPALVNAAVAATIIVAGWSAPAAAAHQAPPLATITAQAPTERGDRASERNLRAVRRRIETMIDHLQRDAHNYAGHRIAAIHQLQDARAEIDAALHGAAGH